MFHIYSADLFMRGRWGLSHHDCLIMDCGLRGMYLNTVVYEFKVFVRLESSKSGVLSDDFVQLLWKARLLSVMGKSDCDLIPSYVSGHINIYFSRNYINVESVWINCQACGYITVVTLAERAAKLLPVLSRLAVTGKGTCTRYVS